MSAFDDILKAEQEANAAIMAAEQSAKEALDLVRQEQKLRLEMKKTELASLSEITLARAEADIRERIKQLRAETNQAIVSFQERVQAQKEQLVKMIVDSFV